jgi:soluble lytic murein transglycosylase-like protein
MLASTLEDVCPCCKLSARMLKRRVSRTAAATAYLKSILLIMLAGVFSVPVTRAVARVGDWIQTPTAQPTAQPLQTVQSLHTPKEIETFIRESARKNGLPEARVVKIAWRESKFIPNARSRSGRYVGIYQFDLLTWRNTPEGRAGLRREDPAANINAAHWHMKIYGFSAWAVR